MTTNAEMLIRYISSQHGSTRLDQAAAALGLNWNEASHAMRSLVTLGLISTEDRGYSAQGAPMMFVSVVDTNATAA